MRLNVEIIVEPRLLRLAKSGAVVGPIWLRSKEKSELAFPETGWTDFPVVVLCWWLNAVEAVLRNTSAEAACPFMDGPFEFVLSRSGELQLRDSGMLVANASPLNVSVQEFWTALHAAASRVLGVCDEREWSNDDVENLRRAIGERPWS
jgi:hypothetical protein